MKRGEVWSVSGRTYSSKPRPAVIIQDDRFDATNSVTVCPFTTTPKDAPLVRLPIEPTEANGLDQTSYIEIDKVNTIRRSQIGDRVGELPREQMIQVGRSLLVFLGFAG